jgi:hypothetical protein
LRQGRAVRVFPLILALTIWTNAVRAQEQEKKLEDRLLRPDMTLANSAQNKKFTGTGVTAADKQFVARSFSAGTERPTKSFSSDTEFSVRDFETRKFARAERAADTKAHTSSADAEFVTAQSSLIRTAPNEGKMTKTRDYPGSRPFLAKGTRQKILSQQNKPLTIDEVRELLNKSK